MNERVFSILSLSLDRGLISPSKDNEAQIRQLFYCRHIPLHITHLVKAPLGTDSQPLDFGADMRVMPCIVPHWLFLFPFALYQGIKILRKKKFDFIQVQEPYLTGLIGVILSKLFNTPLITGLYSDEIDNPIWLKERFLNRFANSVAKYVLRHSKAARSDSLAVAERVSKGGYCPITFIPFLITHADKLMATNPDAPAIRAKLLDGRDGPLLLAVNRLEQEKNIPLMLRAFAHACKTQQGLTLAIAGTGRLEEEMKSLAEQLAPGRVRWLGWVSAAEMAAYYQAADLLLISSDRESAARVLSESLFSGTPVLSTDTAGAREVIEDSYSGCIVPVGDETAFTKALEDLAQKPTLLKEMGSYGRTQVETRMTGPAVAAALRDFYHKAAGA